MITGLAIDLTGRTTVLIGTMFDGQGGAVCTGDR